MTHIVRSGPYTGVQFDRISLAELAIDRADEAKHFLLMGTTGTGKSVAIRELLRGASARGDRAIIADPDGGFRYGSTTRLAATSSSIRSTLGPRPGT